MTFFSFLFVPFFSPFFILLLPLRCQALCWTGESEHPCLVLYFSGNTWDFLYLSWWWLLDWYILPLFCWDMALCLRFPQDLFILRGCWIFSKVSSVSNESIIRLQVYKMNYMYWFLYIELYMHLWDETNLIMVDSLFAVFMLKIFVFLYVVCGLQYICAPCAGARWGFKKGETWGSMELEIRQLWATQCDVGN